MEPLLHAQEGVPQDDNSTGATSGSEAALVAVKEAFSERVKRLVKEAIPAVFKDKIGYPPLRKWMQEIDVGDVKPLRRYGRPLTPPEHEAIRSFIDEGLKEGVIEPSESSWSSPLLHYLRRMVHHKSVSIIKR